MVLQLGWLWTCPQILRPDWKGFSRTNSLAYWASSSVTKEKSFVTLTPGQLWMTLLWWNSNKNNEQI
jgi:hypothetical protein